MKEIVIDPKMFINKPYTECPSCHRQNFGVLHVYGNSYIKRCADCRYDERFSLPDLKRKVIYIDQFVISEMMKSINSSLGKKEKVDPFYLELFKKLDRLNKLQLIVCPDSPIQNAESRLYGSFKELKRMYEQLSHGTSFYHPDTIKRFQAHNAFTEWIGDKTKPLDIYSFIHNSGGIEGWDSRLIISVDFDISDTEIQGIRDDKKELTDRMKNVVDSWMADKKTFENAYETEISIFGPSILKKYFIDLQNYDTAMKSSEDLSGLLLGSLMSDTSILMTGINDALSTKGYSDEDAILKAIEFLNSDAIKMVPYAIISSILYASLANEYTNGRKSYPTSGFFNDVDMIAAYAPYCDAMFIDKECRRLLIIKEAIKKYDLSKKLFSLDNKEEFMEYLDSIEASMTDEHLELVHKVYGENWPEPFLEMYEV